MVLVVLSMIPTAAQARSANSNSDATSEALALFNQGTALLRANRNDEAVAQFERACKISPNFAEGHHEWAIALMKLGRNDDAIDQFNQAIAIDPNLAASWLSLGGAFQTSGKIPQAIAAYRNFVTKFPQDRDTPRVRNLITLLERENDQAILPPPSQSPPPNTAPVNPSGNPAGNPAGNLPPVAPPIPPSLVGPGGDYLADVTRQGVIRWPARRIPLKVFIADGNLIPGYRPGYAVIIRQSFVDWANVSNGLVSFQFVSSPGNGDILCRWSANTAKFKDSAEAAETKLYSDRYGVARGEIEILTLSPSSNQPLTDKAMRGTCLHEIGHVLGLTGHTKMPEDIMFFSNSLSEAWKDLSARDKNTLIRLYSER
jgi:tetratricopeptide (TPR) repeat protein